MIRFKLNGNTVEGEEGHSILQVAEKVGVEIPTLCYHKALEPAGMCRLCVVALFDGRRTRYVTACNYPIWDGMEVHTDSDDVVQIRRLIVELLLARCPEVPVIKGLAERYGIKEPRYKKEEDDCILCGLCVRICERVGASAISLTGRGVDMKVDTPFHIQTEDCLGCGACAFVCPTGRITLRHIQEDHTTREMKPIPSEYDMGLRGRKPIYVPYAQAIPNTPAIDRSRCMHFKTGGCKICKEFCGTGAIDHSQEDEYLELEVGAIVLAPGFKPFDPSQFDTYGYGKHPNVVTSMEFERILSATGPYQGHLLRPLDKREPKKIAWLQCVGSRNVNHCDHAYCSSVCCMYAIKEAIVAKDHTKEPLDTAIFYIDIRTHGKDFERYYNRAQERGVRFVKSRISSVLPVDDTGNLLIRYTDEAGRRIEEEFDLVILSVGLEASREAVELAERLGIELSPHGFSAASSFDPVHTSKPGIFACGVFQGPKDIPQSVMESSACAAVVESTLAEGRGTLTLTKKTPAEIDVRGRSPRIGLFVCNCGVNIGGIVDVPAVVEYGRHLPGVVFVEENLFTCSQDTQEKITQVIKEQGLNRVVVAACSPRTHEALFQETVVNAGINKYLFEMANIRNQCSWVHTGDPQAATEKAKDLLRMAVSKVALLEPLYDPEIEMNQSAMVIGGGISGMTAAKNLADQGYHTYLIEKSDLLGGQALNLFETWRGENVKENLAKLIRDMESNERIDIFLSTQIKKVDGFVGNFKTTVETAGKEHVLEHGVAIIATGASEFKPDQYLYGEDPRVLTGLELDRRFIDDDLPLKEINSVLFIQCVGSRNKERPYCSKVCCTHSVKSALTLKERKPEMEVIIVYRDMRTYGLREELYRQAREKGVVFIRYDYDKELTLVRGQANVQVRFTNYLLQREMEISPDLLVLATAIVPPKENPIAQLFKVPVNDDGFFVEAHVKLRPMDFSTDGVFFCGLAHSPKPIDEAVAQGLGAASRAMTLLSKDRVFGNAVVSQIDPKLCMGCQTCLKACPYQAIRYLEDSLTCEVNQVVCKGCGACSAACPTGAASVSHFTDKALLTMVEAALEA